MNRRKSLCVILDININIYKLSLTNCICMASDYFYRFFLFVLWTYVRSNFMIFFLQIIDEIFLLKLKMYHK